MEYCQQLYRQRLDQGKIAYSYWYNEKLLIQHFKDFFVDKYKRDVISICDLSPALFEDYKTYRIKTRKNCTDSVNKALVPLYEGLKSLYENGLLDHLTYNAIHGKYESNKVTKYDPNVSTKVIRYLTPEQLQDFVKMYHNTNRQKTWEYMQMFLFAVNTGLRISDIATLEWKHIDLKNRHLMKNMVKTKEVVELYLNDAAIEILEIWKKWNRNSRFVFNLLKEDIDFNDSKYVHNAITSKNRIIQTSLRTIGEKMKLPFSLTMHVARHTFAVLAIQNNTDIYEVSKMLGHTSTRCTESTYADFLPISATTMGGVTTETIDVTDLRDKKLAPVIGGAKEIGGRYTKLTIMCKEDRFAILKDAMSQIGVTGMTVSHVMGCGTQKGKTGQYRGVKIDMNLLPQLQVDIVVSTVPPELVVEAAKKALYTGEYGDGKIFLYDVENVVRIRTNETGIAALDNEEK